MAEQLATEGIAEAIETSLGPETDPNAAPMPPREPSVIVTGGNLEIRPEQIDSHLIERIVPAEEPRRARSEPTESVRIERDRERARGKVKEGARGRATSELVFFALAAWLMLSVGIVGTYLVLTTPTGAHVAIHAVPEVSAQVLVDGQLRGRTPLSLEDVPPGHHVITVLAPGFDVTTRELTVSPAADMSVEIALVGPEAP